MFFVLLLDIWSYYDRIFFYSNCAILELFLSYNCANFLSADRLYRKGSAYVSRDEGREIGFFEKNIECYMEGPMSSVIYDVSKWKEW